MAVIWPQGRKPMVLTIFTVADDPATADPAVVIAEAAAAVVTDLV